MSRRNKSLVVITLLIISALHIAMTILPTNVSATTLYVGGSGPGNYTTIQGAINLAASGSTIFVYNGTYFENVWIMTPLSVIGEDRNTTIINGSGSGKVVYIAEDRVTLSGFTIEGGGSAWDEGGIYVEGAESNITNNIVARNEGVGIVFSWSIGNSVVKNNQISDNGYEGILLEQSSGNSITNNSILRNDDNGVTVLFSMDNRIEGNNISYNRWNGIDLHESPNQTVIANDFVHNGVYITGDNISHYNSHTMLNNNTVNGKPLHYRKDCNGLNFDGEPVGQLILVNCTNVEIKNSRIVDTDVGILIAYSSNTSIVSNNVSNNLYGIILRYSSYNEIVGNDVWSNERGINLRVGCEGNTITDNAVSNNTFGMQIWSGSNGNLIDNNSASSNLDNAISFYFSSRNIIRGNSLKHNLRGILLSGGSDNNTVVNNDVLSNSEKGIVLSETRDNQIINNTVNYNGDGISISDTVGEAIVDNEVFSNNQDGILVDFSGYTTIANNSVHLNGGNGINLTLSAYSSIIDNSITSNNGYGIHMYFSNNNLIHHNHFIANPNQSYDEGDNSWDNGYPSGGNYWSDYTGPDIFSGPNQDYPICDGKGDTPYDIPGGTNQDRYPLNFSCIPIPWILLNDPPTVNMSAPTQGETISGEYTITGTASDPEDALQIVEIKIDGSGWIEVTGNASWTFYWDTTNVSNGLHTIHVRSFDGVFYSTDVFVNVTVNNPISDGPDDWLSVVVALSIAIVVVIMMLVYIFFKKRKSKGEKESIEPPPEEPL